MRQDTGPLAEVIEGKADIEIKSSLLCEPQSKKAAAFFRACEALWTERTGAD